MSGMYISINYLYGCMFSSSSSALGGLLSAALRPDKGKNDYDDDDGNNDDDNIIIIKTCLRVTLEIIPRLDCTLCICTRGFVSVYNIVWRVPRWRVYRTYSAVYYSLIV